MKKLLLYILCFMFVLSGCKGKAEANEESTAPIIQSAEGLVINEVMSSNKYWFMAKDGTYPDIVELKNTSNASIDLSGYSITDDETDTSKFIFPSVRIPAGSILLVYCADSTEDISDGVIRTGFKLSSKGETLSVYCGGELVTSLEIPELPSDVSYGINENGEYAYFGLPTPGEENSGVNSHEPYFSGSLIESPLKINEYMPDNANSIIDEDGDRYPWVEIKNTGSEAMNIGGYFLSDNAENTTKWTLPNIELAAGECKVIILSGKNRTGTELHASFKLGSDDKALLLSEYRGKQIDSVEIKREGSGNVSVGRSKDNIFEWLFYAAPTPGKDNTSKGFTRIDISEDKYLPDISV